MDSLQILDEERKALLDSVYQHFIKKQESSEEIKNDEYVGHLLDEIKKLNEAERKIEYQFIDPDLEKYKMSTEEWESFKSEVSEFLSSHNYAINYVNFYDEDQFLEIGAHGVWPAKYKDIDLLEKENDYLTDVYGYAISEMQVCGNSPDAPDFNYYEIIDFTNDHIHVIEKVLEKEMRLESQNIIEKMSLFKGQDHDGDLGRAMG